MIERDVLLILIFARVISPTNNYPLAIFFPCKRGTKVFLIEFPLKDFDEREREREIDVIKK